LLSFNQRQINVMFAQNQISNSLVRITSLTRSFVAIVSQFRSGSRQVRGYQGKNGCNFISPAASLCLTL